MGFVSFREDIIDRMGRDTPSDWFDSISSEAYEVLSAEEIGQRLGFLQQQRQSLVGRRREEEHRLNAANMANIKWPLASSILSNRNAKRPLTSNQVEKQDARSAIRKILEHIKCIDLLIERLMLREPEK